ncbi:hypothetical protein BLOT_005902 [Blomia tropicalis]|nr:hypothetical protein BLOT_005902 [Blomia tropicalis]
MECGKTTKLRKGKAPRVRTEPRDVLSRKFIKKIRQSLQLDVQPTPKVHSPSVPDDSDCILNEGTEGVKCPIEEATDEELMELLDILN